MRYRGNKICPDKWTKAADNRPENRMRLPTMLDGEGIKTEDTD